MEALKTISVIIPAYNREKTIERCIDSVLSQTYPVDEIIVVDDGSTDDTVKRVENINNGIIRILEQNHKGAQAARNLGIKAAKGDYIAFLDSDDEWLPNKLEVQVPYLRGRKDIVVYCDCYEVNRQAGQTRVKIASGGNGNVYKEMLMNSGPMFQGIICSKQALSDIGFLDERVPAHQEWETAIRLSKYNEFVHVREPLFKWYWHSGEAISKDTVRGMKGHEYIVKKHKWEIIKHYGEDGLHKSYERLLCESFRNDNREFLKYFLKWMFIDAIKDIKGGWERKNVK